MSKAGGLWVLVALSLSGCNWFNSGNSNKTDTGNNVQVPPPSCSCAEFPYPKSCESSCEVGDAKIESVDAKAKTAVVTIQHGTQTIKRTIDLSKLPQGVPPEAGAKFTALFKKNAEQPENPRIVAFSAKK